MKFQALLIALLCISAQATTYYISPTGNNASIGTAASTPWKTFAYAIPKLRPGDVLTLLDGTYDASNSGWLFVDSLKGTAAAPITIKAMNERKVWFKGNGRLSVGAYNSQYLVFEGLRISSADDATTGPQCVFMVYRSHHITIRRCLLSNSNRLVNNGLLQLTAARNILAEENEFYNWTGVAVNFGGNDSCAIRRNYFNRRGYAVLNSSFAQETGIQIYPSRNSHNIIENNISETDWGHFTEQTIQSSQNNRFHGNISIGGNWGIVVKARDQYGQLPAYSPTNDIVKDHVSIGSGIGFYGRGGNNTRVLNSSFLDNGSVGFASDVEAINGHDIYEAGTTVSVFAENVLATNSKNAGFMISKQQAWGLNYVNSYNSPLNYNPALPNANITNALQSDPKLGTCKVWIPDNSPMKRAGKNGADIGANVLYRYENGVLTNKPLWDPRTGEFPHGAIVPGVNDIPGKSAFDVHKRLNVNCNSCPFPAGYPTTSAISNPPNQNAAPVQRNFLSITPNFAGTTMSIRTDAQHSAMVEIYNLQGKKIETLNSVSGNSVQWRRGNQPAGVYFVKANSRGITATARMVVGE